MSSAAAKTTTTTMKSALVSEFVSDFSNKSKLDDAIAVAETETKPQLDKDAKKGKNMTVRVLACSLSPGDSMMLRGNAIFMHPAKFPFVPGMDICGIVQDIEPGVTEFKKGDTVVATNGLDPIGGMAEFMKVSTDNAVLKPPLISVIDAAASLSAVTSLHAVDYVNEGDRVLILGGSGGVGTSAITLAKKVSGASLVAATSTQTDLCKELGADVVINYNDENWWEMKEFQKDKFDKIIDGVGGGNFVDKAHLVLKTGKNGGQFIAVTGDDPIPDANTWWKAIKFFAKLPVRPLYTWLTPRSNPGYILLLPTDLKNGLRKVLKEMEDGTLKIKLDPSSPLPFTQDGVQEAFKIVGSGHAHGKVVVEMKE